MKKLLFFVVFIGLIGCVAGCKEEEKKKPESKKVTVPVDSTLTSYDYADSLKALVADFGEACPISLGDFGDLEGIQFNAKERIVTGLIAVNADFVSCKLLKEDKERAYTTANIVMTFDGLGAVLRYMALTESTLVLGFKNTDENTLYRLRVLPEKVRQFAEKEFTEIEINQFLLSNLIAMENADCPQPIINGIEMTGAADEEKNVVYNYSVDDLRYNMAQLKAGEAQLKQQTREMMSNPVAMKVLEMVKSLDKGIIYRYKGVDSGKTIDIVFTPQEIAKMTAKTN